MRYFCHVKIKTDLGCTPLTKHWLTAKYGAPFVLTKKNPTSRYLLSLISKPTNYIPKPVFNTSIQVIISESIYARNGVIFTPQAQRDFDKYVHDLIYDRLFCTQQFLSQLQLDKRVKIKQSIEAFCAAENLPEGILAYDTVKKRWYRERLKVQNANYQTVS